jgi:hypothetical protein
MPDAPLGILLRPPCPARKRYTRNDAVTKISSPSTPAMQTLLMNRRVRDTDMGRCINAKASAIALTIPGNNFSAEFLDQLASVGHHLHRNLPQASPL